LRQKLRVAGVQLQELFDVTELVLGVADFRGDALERSLELGGVAGEFDCDSF
jgi:hypothetical protein